MKTTKHSDRTAPRCAGASSLLPAASRKRTGGNMATEDNAANAIDDLLAKEGVHR